MRTKRIDLQTDEGVGTCTSRGCWAPVSLGRTAQRSSPSEIIARLTAVEHFLPRGKVGLVACGVLTMQNFWRWLTYCGKNRCAVPVSYGEMPFATFYPFRGVTDSSVKGFRCNKGNQMILPPPPFTVMEVQNIEGRQPKCSQLVRGW